MKRNFIIGKTVDNAVEKYLPEIKQYPKLILDNPLDKDSSDIELKILIGLHGNYCKKIRQLTYTEGKSLKWILRMYPELFKPTEDFYILIKFSPKEKEILLESMKETYNIHSPKLSNIYRVIKIETKKN